MSAPVGYDLDRVRHLRRQTLVAIDALRPLSHVDAASALRVVLESQWMPVLTAIERHDPLAGHLATYRPLRGRDTDWLIDRLLELDVDHGGTFVPVDQSEFEDLAAEMVLRAHDDPDVAQRLVEFGDRDLVVLAAVAGGAPAAWLLDMLTFRFGAEPTRGDGDPAERGDVTSTALAYLTTRPGAADLLLDDEWAMGAIMTDSRLDTDVVASLVATAVIDAVDARERFLSFLPWAGRGDFPPGVSRGLAVGFAAVASGLAPQLDHGNHVADIVDDSVHHDDLVALFSRIVVDQVAHDTLVGIMAEVVDRAVPVGLSIAGAVTGDPVGAATALGSELAASVNLVRLIFSDGRYVAQRRFDVAFAAHLRHASGQIGIVDGLIGLAPGSATVRFVTRTLFRFASGHLLPDGPERVPDANTVERLDGVIALLALQHVTASDETWRLAGFDSLSDPAARRLRELADPDGASEPVDASSLERLLVELDLPAADEARVRNWLVTVVNAAGADP